MSSGIAWHLRDQLIRFHPLVQIQGDVPKTVHNLLASTKQLQEVLEDWSFGRATETQVSDVYVQIGTEFNATIAAFAYHQIDLRCVTPYLDNCKLG